MYIQIMSAVGWETEVTCGGHVAKTNSDVILSNNATTIEKEDSFRFGFFTLCMRLQMLSMLSYTNRFLELCMMY